MTRVRTGLQGGLVRGGAVAATVLMLAACASTEEGASTADGGTAAGSNAPQLAAATYSPPDIDNPDAESDALVEDPLEDWNRFVFDLNTLIYTLLQPVIAPYGVLPEERKRNVDNFVHNLSTPVILVNDLLQGETDRAWITTQRFFVNTVAGLGLFDPASEMGLPKHSEDFGQTLGVWGVSDGPYMVYPLIGPSNPRDGVGRVVDMVTDPLFWISGSTAEAVSYSKTYVSTSSQLGSGVNRMEGLRESSLDFYAAVRSLYTQNRRAAIANQEEGPAAGPGSIAPPADAFGDETDLGDAADDADVNGGEGEGEGSAAANAAADGSQSSGPDVLHIRVQGTGGTQQ